MHRRTFMTTAASILAAPYALAQPPTPRVWQLNASDLYLAPTLEEAIQSSMALSQSSRADVFDPRYGYVVSEEEIAAMPYFFKDDGSERSGLDVYRELIASGVTIQPFAINDD